MKKARWAVFLSVILAVSAVLPAAGYRIGDTQTEIPLAKQEAEVLAQLHLFYGTEDGMELERGVTRAEAAALAVRMAGEEKTALSGNKMTGFSDVEETSWMAPHIAFGVERGYINGVSETEFLPGRGVTGREFAKMLLGIMGYRDLTLDNVYEKAIEAGLFSNEYARLAVEAADYQLLRSDAVYLCYASLLAKTASGATVLDQLVEKQVCTQEDADRLLAAKNENTQPLSWKLREWMPQDENYMYSPLSLEMALALIANGAEGKTQEEILSLLSTSEIAQYNEYAKGLMAEYAQKDKVAIEIANSIWLNTDHPSKMQFLDSYKALVKEFYDGEAGEINRQNALSTVNGWVKEKTHGKITDILTEDLVDREDFLACLLNAVYFKAAWAKPFAASQTKKDIFTDKNGKQSEISFLNQTLQALYYADDTMQMVRLPYEDYNFSMYLVLGECENPEKYLDFMENKRVELMMPKFKVETATSFDEALKSMGMNLAYDSALAEFGAMTTPNPDYNTYLMTVLQKTYIEVDENGTEAAVITMGGMGGATSAIQQPELVVFRADQPFVFFIRDDKNDQVLFIGEYAFAQAN